MNIYAKVTIKQFYDSPELDKGDYIAQHGEPPDHCMVRLYIVYSDPRPDKPELLEQGYLSGSYYYSQVKDMHLRPADRNPHLTGYLINGRRVAMPVNEPMAYQTVRPVPRPKTRAETEWRDGQWWKYLKAQGWVRA